MKVIGNGMIAKAFSRHYKESVIDLTIFASGVSNSLEMAEIEYMREESLLLEQSKHRKIIYFSSCSLFDASKSNSKYFQKKLHFEKIIQDHFNNYLIIRLPQVVGHSGNRNNLVSFIYNSVKNKENFIVEKFSYRNLIDIDDIVRFSSKIIEHESGVINLASPYKTKILDIVRIVESILKLSGNYEIVEFGSSYEIDISRISLLIPGYLDYFPNTYNEKLIRKYFEN